MIYLGKNPIGISNVRMPSLTAGPAPILNFTANTNMPLISSKLTFSPVQEGTGDPSPSNVRPIKGWTGVTATHCGKNLINPVTNTNNKFIDASGNIQNSDNFSFTDYIPVKNASYTVTGISNNANANMRIHGYDGNYNWVKQIAYQLITQVNMQYNITFTLQSSDNISFVRVSMNARDVQLELGSTATAYEPYQGTTYPITFPVMGKNLLNPQEFGKDSYYYTLNGDIVTVNRCDTRAWTGQGVASILLQPGTYTLSVSNPSGYMTARKSTDNYGSLIVDSNTGSATFTLSEACTVKIKLGWDDVQYSTTVQLEEGSTSTAYEPFNNTVYGGYVDLKTGEVWADKKSVTVNEITNVYESYIKSDAIDGFIENNEIYPSEYSGAPNRPIYLADKLKFSNNGGLWKNVGLSNRFGINYN